MFGISLSEIALIAVVTLVVVGPQKLPGMLRTVGQWIGKLRRLTTEVRAQTGIDDILRSEGIDGGLNELRGILRGDSRGPLRSSARDAADDDPYAQGAELDRTREYPLEGADAHGALPDDLVDDEAADPGPEPELAPAAAEDVERSNAPPWQPPTPSKNDAPQ